MPKSMTAFGRAEIRDQWGELSCELRSVNHRYLETYLRLPEELRTLEPQIRELVAAHCSRGKIECSFRLKTTPSANNKIELNEPLAEAVLSACHRLENFMLNAARTAAIDILRWPGVIKENETDPQPLLQAALNLFDKVMQDFLATREREGEGIRELLLERCQTISGLVATQRQRAPEIFARYKEKLLARLAELPIEADANRLEQELVYLAQKMDVEEELDRLDTHVKEARRVLALKEPVGRRLDFLMQEFNREANTLGSKSSDASSSQTAIDLKVIIEQMREQVQNLE